MTGNRWRYECGRGRAGVTILTSRRLLRGDCGICLSAVRHSNRSDTIVAHLLARSVIIRDWLASRGSRDSTVAYCRITVGYGQCVYIYVNRRTSVCPHVCHTSWHASRRLRLAHGRTAYGQEHSSGSCVRRWRHSPTIVHRSPTGLTNIGVRMRASKSGNGCAPPEFAQNFIF